MATVEYKIAIVGPSKSGKTSFFASVFNKQHFGKYSPTIEEIHKEDYEFENKKYKLTIFDTSGSEEYLFLLQDMVPKFDGIIIVLDKTEKDSLKVLPSYVDLNKEKKPLIIVCNKSDIVKDSINGVQYFGEVLDISVQTKQNVTESFQKLIKMINERGVLNMKERRKSMGLSEIEVLYTEPSTPQPKKRSSSLKQNEKRLSLNFGRNRKSAGQSESQKFDLQKMIQEEDERKRNEEEGKKKEEEKKEDEKKDKRKSLKNLIDIFKKK